MFAIQEDELAIAVLAMVGGFGVAIVGMVISFKTRAKRLSVIERALANNDTLDEATRRTLTEELTGKKVQDPNSESLRRSVGRQISMLGRNFLFVVGWLALFTGVGLMVTGDSSMIEAGAIVSCIGFGVVTVPLALRELESRGQIHRS